MFVGAVDSGVVLVEVALPVRVLLPLPVIVEFPVVTFPALAVAEGAGVIVKRKVCVVVLICLLGPSVTSTVKEVDTETDAFDDWEAVTDAFEAAVASKGIARVMKMVDLILTGIRASTLRV